MPGADRFESPDTKPNITNNNQQGGDVIAAAAALKDAPTLL
jgi:hypothetical protein